MWPFRKPAGVRRQASHAAPAGASHPSARGPSGVPEERVEGVGLAIEKREYVDAIVAAIIAARTGGVAELYPYETGAVETAAGIWSRAFAQGRTDGYEVEAEVLAAMGRDLVLLGETVWTEHRGVLVRAASVVVEGMATAEAEWQYRLEVPAPSGVWSLRRPGRDVVHARWSVDRSRPWKGVAPVDRARLPMGALASVERRLGQELGAPVGWLLPIPRDASEASVASLGADLAAADGKTLLVESAAGGWGDRGAAPQQDWTPRRIGGQPAETVLRARSELQLSVLAACGIPPEIVVQVSEGTGQREAWRRFLHGSVAPMGRLVAQQLSGVAGSPVTLDFEHLMASDVQGRARAFQSLVQSGMDPGAAAGASGLLDPEN